MQEQCFNLVIEVLLISRLSQSRSDKTSQASFNLVIEVLLISRRWKWEQGIAGTMFQSRNRGSFDFKVKSITVGQDITGEFQSRNRGSFDFKNVRFQINALGYKSFNLVIEVLLISSQQRHRPLSNPYRVSIS